MQPRKISNRRHLRALLVGSALLLLPLGCGDLDTGSLVEVEADSPVPSLHLGQGIPTLPTVVSRWGQGISVDGVEEDWENSWRLPEAEGMRRRSEHAQALATLLAPQIPEEELQQMVGRLEQALEDLSVALDGQALAALEGPVGDAAGHAERAVAALQAGDRTQALRWCLEASDQLRAATPEVVARTLLREAEELLRRERSSTPYSEERELRIRRLLIGAEDALESGDAARALRRAWYAVGLIRDALEHPAPGNPGDAQEGDR